MAFFDDLGAKLTQTGQKTKQMASSLVDSAKLTTHLGDLSKSLQDCYAQLGEAYFNLHGDAPEEDLDTLSAQAAGLQADIALVRADLQRVKNIRVCAQCSHENPPDASFCGKCSTPLPPLPQHSAPEAATFCPSCGLPLLAGARFCTKCGTKLD